MDILKENIRKIVNNITDKNGFYLIDLIIRGIPRNRVIEVYIDGEKDVTAENCAKVSREIELQLEKLIVLEPSYRLEVSSPGIDRPLKYLKQYPKNINRKFGITYLSENNVKTIIGKLLKIEGESLVFLTNDKKETKINFNNIKKAKVLISFS
ncbi:MAG TPA: hypothetical protein ENI61_07065 [Ignavibacteria bacterium]|nr:hypothetical protein [Ignavibacteria bacterium]